MLSKLSITDILSANDKCSLSNNTSKSISLSRLASPRASLPKRTNSALGKSLFNVRLILFTILVRFIEYLTFQRAKVRQKSDYTKFAVISVCQRSFSTYPAGRFARFYVCAARYSVSRSLRRCFNNLKRPTLNDMDSSCALTSILYPGLLYADSLQHRQREEE